MGKLTFYGGALSVTGSNYLLETQSAKVLVDCGLFQGGKPCPDENFERFAYDASSLDAALVTHAHIDHTGRLPKLIKEGFSGPIFAIGPTAQLAEVMLEDSQGLIEEECAERGELLYTMEDVRRTARQFSQVSYGKMVDVAPGVRARFRNAGHVLGSACIEVWVKEPGVETKFIFSGDLGNPPTPLLPPTEYLEEADYVLIETTYGSRLHEDRKERRAILEKAIEDTINNGGTLLIPAFAIERTQELLFELNHLVENKKIPEVPIFLDSPLAIAATDIYRNSGDYFNVKATDLVKGGDDLFKFPRLVFTHTTDESKAINAVKPPKVIIAGSGMSTGGRILHHERRYLSDPASMILFIGYQAQGTLGRRILEGENEVKIFGETVPVLCQKRAIGGYSAHADQRGLLKWLESIQKGGKLKRVFCVQGEEDAAGVFAQKAQADLGVEAVVPAPTSSFEF